MLTPPTASSLTANLRNILRLDDLSGDHFAGLLVGLPGSGKSVFCMQLAYEHLRTNSKVVYVVTAGSPSRFVERMKRFGWDVQRDVGRRLRFVDLFSWQVDGNMNFEDTWYGFRVCPLNSVELLEGTQRILKHIRKRAGIVILDSLTLLVQFLGEEHARRFIPTFNARIQELGYMMGTLDSKVLSERCEAFIRSCHNLVIQLKSEEDKQQRSLCIAKFEHRNHPVGRIPFKITNHGIMLGAFQYALASQPRNSPGIERN